MKVMNATQYEYIYILRNICGNLKMCFIDLVSISFSAFIESITKL